MKIQNNKELKYPINFNSKPKYYFLPIFSLVFLFIFLIVSPLSAHTDILQEKKITVRHTQTPLDRIISDIEQKSGYSVIVRLNDVDIKERYSIDATDQSLHQILTTLFRGKDIGFELKGNTLSIFKSRTQPAHTAPPSKRQIRGTVIDEKNEPVIGANILEKGTTNGVVTDADGQFSISVPVGAMLQVSYIGYLNQEIRIGNQNVLQIVLKEDAQSLEEVVVVGYGTQKKINMSGAVETLNARTLENRSTSNLGVALQGLVPNLDISPGGGQADNVPSFNIRGATSINGGVPLILVDGIPTNADDFSRMNSMDVESISVLKDASSAAIYGARAAFGVILVTTKKGTEGKLKVRFNNTFNARTLTRMPQVVVDPYIQASYKKEMGKPWYDLYSDQAIEYARQRRDDPSLPGTILSDRDPNVYLYLDAHDWFDDIFDRVGISHSHNLSISGATDKVSNYLGAEFYRERGMLHYNKDTYNRFNVKNRVEYKPVEWLTIGNNTALTYYTYEKPTNFGSWLYSVANETNCLVPVYNPDGSYTGEGATLIGTLKDGGEYKKDEYVVYTQFNADLALIKNIWNLKADFTAKLTNYQENQWDSDRNIPYKKGPGQEDLYLGWENYAQRKNGKTIYTMFNLFTDFQKEFGIHSFSAVAGFSQEYTSSKYLFSKRKDLILDTYPTPQLATGDMTIEEWNYTWAIRSGFFRLNYVFNGKYILETNGRYDGTSRFPKDDRFGFFPSVSAAWILSKENFFKPLEDWFSYAKLRVSYGSLGNQALNPNSPDYYPYISNMSASKLNYLLNKEKPMAVYPSGLVSDALTWEKVYTFNIGVDVNFFRNRLTVSGDVYRRDTKDMLTKGKTLPNVLGTSEPQINAADMKTKGWEISVLWRDQLNAGSAPINYSARFILSDSRSFITKFDNPTGYLGDYYVGQELGEIWGLVTDGFFKDQADIDNHADQWDVMAYPGDRPLEPGDLKYKDLNNDGKINQGAWTLEDHGDYKKIGNNRNRYLFGLDLNADWKGFDLRLLFQGVGKKDWYPFGYKFSGIYLAPWGNVLTNNLDHWTPENPTATFPRPKSYLANGDGDISHNQTRYLQNAAYLRMKNLTFGYTLPRIWMKKINVESVRLYFSGENLFEITSLLKNYDPEALNQTAHPFQRTFSIGLNITL